MLVHSVFFWLKPELTADERAKFRRAVEGLKQISAISQCYVGTPAPTGDRGPIDRSYSVCLTTLFHDIAAHDEYQVHPLHVQFIEQNNKYWTKVVIYDAE